MSGALELIDLGDVTVETKQLGWFGWPDNAYVPSSWGLD